MERQDDYRPVDTSCMMKSTFKSGFCDPHPESSGVCRDPVAVRSRPPAMLFDTLRGRGD